MLLLLLLFYFSSANIHLILNIVCLFTHFYDMYVLGPILT